ncbi:hypothetical protein [Glaciibacter superstes]|uniref:hypothetical protein n=1 Tax=Glaciibacter superstes TaxID=501023 RepID=UPI0003B56C53|nr:hypothetical protein [Glaciibacter superstes]
MNAETPVFDAAVDLALIQHLDWEYEVACKIRARTEYDPMPEACPHPATFIARCRVCGIGVPSCEDHRRVLLACRSVLCVCKAVAPGAELLQFVPLPGGAS